MPQISADDASVLLIIALHPRIPEDMYQRLIATIKNRWTLGLAQAVRERATEGYFRLGNRYTPKQKAMAKYIIEVAEYSWRGIRENPPRPISRKLPRSHR